MLDAAYCFSQSDPLLNRQFGRWWSERAFTPSDLDRLADHELQHGHVRRAEQLAHRAAQLREVAR